MPRKKPPPFTRVQVPVELTHLDVIDDFCAVTGRSRASVCQELIAECIPALQQIINVIETMDMNPATGILKVAEIADRLSQEARQASLDLEWEAEKRAK